MGAGCALPALQPRPQRLVERLGDVGAGQVARQNQAQRHREPQLQQAVVEGLVLGQPGRGPGGLPVRGRSGMVS